MVEQLKRLWLEGKLSLKGLENALAKGWITIQEKEEIEGTRAE